MEKRMRMEGVDGEIVLPEAIIQHVQSFLTGKEAAQTTVISKSWYSAWLTRPNLDLDQRDYGIRAYGFYALAKRIVQRYQELNLKIESCRLFINDHSFGNELIVTAMKMGAFDLHFETQFSTMVLPHEVLGSENLLRLSVTGCKIDGKSPHFVTSSTRMLALNHGLINLYEFRKLKCLFLEKVKISSLFFGEFSLKFPCLKDLTVRHCFGYKEIQIHSPSLQYISFAHKRILRAKFDVPSIRRFSFSGSKVPSLSFGRAYREWKSEISITWKRFNTKWFLKLNKFLGDLSQSNITLSLVTGVVSLENFVFPEDVGSAKPVVENLMMGAASSVSSSILDGLFWSFHPKSIYQFWMPKSSAEDKENDLLELLCKTLVQEGSENHCIPNRNTRALLDLEEVNVDLLEESLGRFQPLPWNMLLDASTSPENRRVIRFRLQWGTGGSTIK